MTLRSLVAVLVLASCRVPGAASESDTIARQLAALGIEFSQASAADADYAERELERISFENSPGDGSPAGRRTGDRLEPSDLRFARVRARGR